MLFKPTRRAVATVQQQLIGNAETVNSQSITVLEKDSNGDILRCTGTVTVSDGGSGYAKGCIYIKTNVSAGSTGIYENVGTNTSCNFDTIGSGGSGSTTFVGLTDTPSNYTSAANKILKVNTGADAVEFVAVSGDVAMSATGVMTVTDLTITNEAQGDLLYFDGTNWVRLAAGTNGYILKTQGAAANPVWIDPATLPTGIATGLSQSFTMEGGTNDITVSVTTQTVGAGALTIPDFAGVADTYAFITLAQTLKNKTLDDASTKFGDTADSTKDLFFSLGGATTDKTMTIISSQTDDRSITLPDATTTLVGTDTTDTLSNKTLTSPIIVTTGAIVDAGGDEYLKFVEAATPVTYIQITSGDTGVAPRLQGAGETNTDLHLLGSGTGNVYISDGTDPTKDITFELNGATTAKTMTIISSQTDDRSLTLPDATDTLVGKATTDTLTNKTLDCDGTGNVVTNVNGDELDSVTGNTYGVAVIWKYSLSNQASPVNITTNAPFKFQVLDAWSVNKSADGGTWKLDNGSNDLCSAVTVAASDQDIDRAADLDDDYATINATGTLRIVPDAGGALDCEIYLLIMRVD